MATRKSLSTSRAKLLKLPIAPITTTLVEAFDVMSKARRSAVLVKSRSGYLIFHASSVVIAQAEGRAKTLGDLKPTATLPISSAAKPSPHVLARAPQKVREIPLAGMKALTFGIEAVLTQQPTILGREEEQDDEGGNEGAAGEGGDAGPAVTSRARALAALFEPGPPSACYCTVDGKAVARPPGKNNGPCPHDPLHHNSVRCLQRRR